GWTRGWWRRRAGFPGPARGRRGRRSKPGAAAWSRRPRWWDGPDCRRPSPAGRPGCARARPRRCRARSGWWRRSAPCPGRPRAAGGRRGGSARARARRPRGPDRRRGAGASPGGGVPLRSRRRRSAACGGSRRARRLLAVAGGAVDGWGDPQVLLELGSDAELLGRGGVPARVRDSVEGPQVALGGDVAVEAPLHGQGGDGKDGGHRIDPAVAARAADPPLDVDAVAEEDEVGDGVHPFPGNRDVVEVALAKGLED